jgi:hypothetical protein
MPIFAKDENRPHLMPSAFASDAHLEMRVETENISFTPASKGIEEITQVLGEILDWLMKISTLSVWIGLPRTVRLTSGVAGW